MQGLMEELKDELAALYLPEHLEALCNLLITLDNCLHEQRRDCWSFSHSATLNKCQSTPTPPPGELGLEASVVEPMQLAATNFPSPTQGSWESKNS